MRRLICPFVFRIWHKTHFLMAWLTWILKLNHTVKPPKDANEWQTVTPDQTAPFGSIVCTFKSSLTCIRIYTGSQICQTQYLHEPPHDKTNKMTLRPAKTQISLGIRPVWSESSLWSQWVAKDPSFLHADSEDWSDWADGRTCHFFGFLMRRLTCRIYATSILIIMAFFVRLVVTHCFQCCPVIGICLWLFDPWGDMFSNAYKMSHNFSCQSLFTPSAHDLSENSLTDAKKVFIFEFTDVP